MKKILLFILPLALFAASCTRQDIGPRPPIDEAYWLNQERGVVVYSSFNCDFYVVETSFGFSVLQSWGGFTPLRGSVLYGNLSRYGVQTLYNRSEGYLVQANVRDYWLSYWEALDQADFECAR